MAENQTITLRCPKCGDPYRFEAPTVMNAGKEEDLPALVKLFESAESGFKKENPFTFMCPLRARGKLGLARAPRLFPVPRL